MEPQDEFNQILEKNVHPSDWVAPKPAPVYNLVVVGAGTAGLVTAAVAAGLGARVALVERERMGGDCLNVGCVPSKGIIAAARQFSSVKKAALFGVNFGSSDPTIDFAQVMSRMRKIRADISPDDSATRFKNLGVDVFYGQGRFRDANSLEVANHVLKFKKAVIATGARAQAPPIPGLDQVSYLNNESLFSLTELPSRFGVIGGGPIGAEMSQAFARLGSQVVLFEKSDSILSREDRDAASIVQNALIRDGVDIRTHVSNLSFSPTNRKIGFQYQIGGKSFDGELDQLLVAVGRTPNVDGMGLDNAGVAFDPNSGVTVNDRLQTTNPNIYAAGDVCSKYKFTHAADFMARTVIANALFFGRSRVSQLVIPWTTYTDPELAHVGILPDEAERLGLRIQSFTRHYSDVHRATLEGDDDGFIRVHVKKGTDKILGATAVGARAGDHISHLTFAITHHLGLKKLAATIHPYPTHSEAIRQLGDLYKKSTVSPNISAPLTTFFNWRRR